MRFPFIEPGTHSPPRVLRALAIALAIARAFAPAPAHASHEDESLLFRELPSVFGASKFEQPLSDAPSSVSIVTAEDIRRFGYRTLADILASANGYYVTNDGNYSYIGARGFNRTGDYNSRLLVQIDGHKINDTVFGTASLGTEAPIDVSLIERVEIIRGPTSSLYGANAIFGVVNIITRRGRDLDGSVLGVGAGSNATYTGQLQTGKRLENGLEYLVSASAGSSDGMRRIHYPELDRPATDFGIARNVDWDRNRKLFAKAQFEEFTAIAALSTRTKAIPTGSYGTIFNDPGNKTTDNQAYLELQHVADAWGGQLRSRLFYDSYEYSGDFVYDFPPRLVNKDSSNGKRLGAELLWTRRIANRHKLTVGGEWNDNSVVNQKNYDATLKLDDQRRHRSSGLYLQDEWHISDAWLANVGLRYDDYSQFGSSINPRAALIFRARPSSTLKLLAGRAFRPPNAYELYYNDGLVTQKGNPLLRAEVIRTTEAVWEEQFSRQLRGTLNLYRYRIDNLITQQTDPADGLLVFVNQEAVDARGAEFELERKWDNGASARVSLANQSNRDRRTGTMLTGSPRTLIKSRVALPIGATRWFAAAEANHVSARQTLAGNTVSSFWVANLTLTGDRVLPGAKVSIGLYNLTDRRYFDPGGSEHRQDQLPQPGRMLFGRVEIAF